MTTPSNSWYDELVNVTKRLYADKILFDSLDLGNYFTRLAKRELNAKDIIYKNPTSLVDTLKQSYRKSGESKNLDYDDIKSRISFLKGLCSDVESTQSGDKQLSFKFNIDKISRDSESLALTLIAYIQYKHGVQTNEAFAKEFITLINSIDENRHSISTEDNSNNQKATGSTENKTLILIFGQSHKLLINDIVSRKTFNDNDYDLLENKCEWFWFGYENKKPTEINKNPTDNMCWLQINIKLSDTVIIKNLLHLKDLIKKVKKQPAIVIQLHSSDSTTFNLDNKEFIKS